MIVYLTCRDRKRRIRILIDSEMQADGLQDALSDQPNLINVLKDAGIYTPGPVLGLIHTDKLREAA